MNMENEKTQGTGKEDRKKITSKQVVAMVGVVLLVLMYVLTLVMAVIDTSASGRFFMLSLGCTFVIPVIIFLYSWMYGRLTGGKAIGDPDDPRETVGQLTDTEGE
ncbi:MAG: hypothetical protein NC092_02645 [Butyrivibrio sp.]|nr:hypothetical protein [Muribaculum sp.]MCM1551572.1 hypothetical protein [Butyrivibrio sp.]